MNLERIPENYDELFSGLSQNLNTQSYEKNIDNKIYNGGEGFNGMINSISNYEKDNFDFIRVPYGPKGYIKPSKEFVVNRVESLLITEKIENNSIYIKENLKKVFSMVKNNEEYKFLKETIELIESEFEKSNYDKDKLNNKSNLIYEMSMISKIYPLGELKMFFKNLMHSL